MIELPSAQLASGGPLGKLPSNALELPIGEMMGRAKGARDGKSSSDHVKISLSDLPCFL